MICISLLGCGDTIYSKNLLFAAITASRRLLNLDQAYFIYALTLMQNCNQRDLSVVGLIVDECLDVKPFL